MENKENAEKKSILIVEDELIIRDTVTMYLESMDYEVTQAVDGVEAIDIVRKSVEAGREFDLMIIDINMPRMNGIGVLRELDNLKVKSKRIIALGVDSDDIQSELGQFSFDAEIKKPFTPSELVNLIVKL